MQFIDAHCHLNAHEFVSDIDQVITRAKANGIRAVVVVTETAQDFYRTLELCDQYPDWIYPCLGLHPIQDGRSVSRQDFEAALPVIKKFRNRLVGIGEIGLDFSPWICKSPEDKAEQECVFRMQIELAKSFDLPVNVHSRSASKRAVEILIEEGAKKVLLHNFAGRPSVALQAATHGFYLSFPPLVVNKPERDKLLRQVSLHHICLETDSPALAMDLDERNEPAKITEACKHIAKLKDVDAASFSKIVLQNTLKLFTKIKLI